MTQARRRRVHTMVGGIVLVGMLVPTAVAAEEASSPSSSLTSTDNGDGTYGVPLLNSDVPDISVARVPAAENAEGRDVYYMISTTMHLSPGAPIMKSYDLVNWETVNYVYDRLGIGDAPSLRNGQNSYGEGQWASSLRYHDGRFYVAFNTNNLGGAYIYSTDDIEDGTWEKVALGRGFHDLSLFFDEADGGTPYIFHGSGSTSAVQLSDDLTTIVAEYPDIFGSKDFPDFPILASGMHYEGTQVSYRDGYYYMTTITWPAGGNRQVVLFRSKELLGRYTAVDGTNTYEVRSGLDSDGFAQGGLVDIASADGGTDWYGMFFRDTYPLGRIPALIPATWEDGWPTFGDDGVVHVGDTFTKPITLTPEQDRVERLKSVVASDDFANDAEHKTFRDTRWEIPQAPEYDESLLGVELVSNPGFEDAGVEPWGSQFGAIISRDPSTASSGTAALRVSNRTVNGSAPHQQLDGKIQAGITYEISARVRYTEGPDSVRFDVVGDWGTGVKALAGVEAAKGEWATIAGAYTIPADADVRSFKLAVETPWANPQPPSSSVEYVLDDVSVTGQVPQLEHVHADEVAYNGSDLDLAWEWNHNPDNRYWSLTEREGWLRLTNGHVVTGEAEYSKAPGRDLTYLEEARNTLSQRTFGPTGSAETRLDVSGMLDGDVAGLAVYGRSFTYAGIKQVDDTRTLGLVTRLQPFDESIDAAAVESFVPGTTIDLGSRTDVRLKADTDFSSAPEQLWVQFSYSLDGRTWQPLGPPQGPIVMDWSLSHFMANRFGLFSYATEQTGGTVDFDYYYLSDVLDAEEGADRRTLDAAIDEAQGLDEQRYTPESWTVVEKALGWALATTSPSTQNQVDAPAHALSVSLASLVRRDASEVAFTAEAVVRPVAGKDVVTVRVINGEDAPVDVTVATPYGTKTFASVSPGKSAQQSFATRLAAVPAGVATVTVTRIVDEETTSRAIAFGPTGS